MNKTGKTIITLLGIAVIGLGGSAFAETDDARLSQLNRDELRELRELGDRDAFREKLEDLEINRPMRPQLTDEQKDVIEELKEDGDREAIREQLDEFGVELPTRPEITDEQKEKIQELREDGDKEVLKEYFEEIGLKKPRKFIAKRAQVVDSLSDDEREVLAEARDIARAGDKETAREMIREIFEGIAGDEDTPKGFFGFFKRIFK